MDLENYQKEKLTINLAWANIFGIIMFIPIILIFGLPYYLMWKNQFINEVFVKMIRNSFLANPISSLLIFLSSLLAGIILHELIHGIVWAFFAKNKFKSIKFGVLLKMLTPYCHCKEPLKVYQYIIGAIMPGILLGIMPSIVAIVMGDFALLVFGIFFTVAACGDLLIINLLRKENAEDFVQDHPSEAGCYIYRKNK